MRKLFRQKKTHKELKPEKQNIYDSKQPLTVTGRAPTKLHLNLFLFVPIGKSHIPNAHDITHTPFLWGEEVPLSKILLTRLYLTLGRIGQITLKP